MPKAKNAQVFEKDPLNWYVEPQDCTAALLSVETFSGGVWDPACGGGNVLKACAAAGLRAVGTDLMRRDVPEELWRGHLDFIAEPHIWLRAPNIVCNPPFYGGKGTETYVRRALALPGLLKLAVFVETRFLGGSRRARELYRAHPPARVWWVTPRPSCPPGDFLAAGGEAKGGTPDFCWIVWEAFNPRPPGSMAPLGWCTRPEGAKGRTLL